MDFQDLRKKTIEHYAQLGMNKGWIAYTKHRIRQMEKDDLNLWVGLYEEVKNRIEELKKCNS